MPFHVQPVLRAREEAWESFGLIATLDTVEVTQYKASQGVTIPPKQNPLFVVKVGTSTYTPA